MCPECSSEKVYATPYDYGIDSDTGYHDQGEMARCSECGWQGVPEDVVPPRYMRCALRRDHAGPHFFLRFRTRELSSWECPVVPSGEHEEAA